MHAERNSAPTGADAVPDSTTARIPDGLGRSACTRVSETDFGNASNDIDVYQHANDQIARLVMARFKGHGLTLLVDAILRAQGYTTYRSPDGGDGGADILAGAGPLGFGAPRLAVEEKSESSRATARRSTSCSEQ
jgi:predicted Mrr-cat superfamily restriction endonuclease